MPHSIAERVERWIMDIDADHLLDIYAQIEYLADRRFRDYEPTTGPYPDFWVRLRDWLNSAADERDQRLLFELVSHIFFVGEAELKALYRAAFHGPIAHWLVDQLNVRLDGRRTPQRLEEGLRRTWFLPITDSLIINSFYHINHIEGLEYRPDVLSLERFAAEDRVRNYVRDNGIQRLVLLEDFVGSGKQMIDALAVIDRLRLQQPILIVPLIICPAGVTEGKGLEAQHDGVSFSPVLELSDYAFITTILPDNERLGVFFAQMRDLVVRLYPQVSGRQRVNRNRKPYGPFGYRDTGALVVKHNNCPNNTIPLIHHRSASWHPLFPRSSRE